MPLLTIFQQGINQEIERSGAKYLCIELEQMFSFEFFYFTLKVLFINGWSHNIKISLSYCRELIDMSRPGAANTGPVGPHEPFLAFQNFWNGLHRRFKVTKIR